MRKAGMLSIMTGLLMAGAESVLYGYDYLGFVTGENSGDQYATALGTVDFNADGFPDLAVGAPAADDAGLSSGKVHLYFGGPGADTIADLTFIGVAGSFFGQSLSSAGDFDNDGYEDLLVGAPFYDLPGSNGGGVFLFYGDPSPDTAVDHICTGEAEGDYFGTSVSRAGDFNNDTYSDIVMGAYQADWGSFTGFGKAYVFYGGLSPDFHVDRILVGDADGERLGTAVTGADFNGDGWSDVAAGAYSYDSASAINRGRVYIFYGGAAPDTVPDLRITGDSAGYKFGWSLTTGKINNDPYDDLIMGTDGFSIDTFAAGKVYVFFGGTAFDNAPDYTNTLGRSQDDYLGDAVAASVDLNEDGFDDMIAGMPGNNDGGADAGGAIVFTGGSSIDPDESVLAADPGEEAGEAVTLWRGYGDVHTHAVLVGAPAYDNSRGRLFLFGKSNQVANQAPVLDSIGPKSVVALSDVTFTVSASDPDLDRLTLIGPDVPAGAGFSDRGDGTGTFEWTPQLPDVGSLQATFIAADGDLVDSETVEITVVDTADCCLDRGNADRVSSAGGSVDIADVTYLVGYLFLSGPPPPCREEGNADGLVSAGGPIDVADLTYLVGYLFLNGPVPPTC